MNNQNTISIDISNYLRKLIQSGEKIPAKLSFLLAITDSRLPGYDSDNAGFDAFQRRRTKGLSRLFRQIDLANWSTASRG